METLNTTETDGNIILKWTNENNQEHRTDGPALIVLASDGRLLEQVYFNNGKLHRTDGPAITTYWSTTGLVKSWQWFRNGKFYRENDLPVHLIFSEHEGSCEYSAWLNEDNLLHNDTVPAVQRHGPDGDSFEFWLNGVQLTQQQWQQERLKYVREEMTIEQIETLLGRKIKIVDNK